MRTVERKIEDNKKLLIGLKNFLKIVPETHKQYCLDSIDLCKRRIKVLEQSL